MPSSACKKKHNKHKDHHSLHTVTKQHKKDYTIIDKMYKNSNIDVNNAFIFVRLFIIYTYFFLGYVLSCVVHWLLFCSLQYTTIVFFFNDTATTEIYTY